jgi:hypothetical protein
VDQFLEFRTDVFPLAGGGAELEIRGEIVGVEAEEGLPLRGPHAVLGNEGSFEDGGVGKGHFDVEQVAWMCFWGCGAGIPELTKFYELGSM